MSGHEKWIDFALRDLDGAEILFEKDRYHLACYLAQQTAEKALKAFLAGHSKKVPHIHELDELHKRCLALDSSFQSIIQHCLDLNIFYNPVRYPEAEPGILPEGFPTREQTESALSKAKEVLNFVQQRLADIEKPAPEDGATTGHG
jgi:HEPN domain-containing protein